MVLRLQVTRVDIHMNVVNQLLNSPSGEVVDLVRETGQSVKRACQRECPVDTGAMRTLHYFTLRVVPFRYVMGRVLNTDEAAMWVQTGTGIYATGRSGPGPRLPQAPRPAGAGAARRTRKRVQKQARSTPPPGVIRPKRAKALRFIGKRDGALLVLPWVKGQPANPFMWRGLVQGTATSGQVWTLQRHF